MFLLDSHFLRINGLIDADSLQKRSGGAGGDGKSSGFPWSPLTP